MRTHLLFKSVLWIGVMVSASLRAETIPNLNYESAFQGYEGYKPVEQADWAKANNKVGEIGGWRSYAREASETEKSQNPGDSAMS